MEEVKARGAVTIAVSRAASEFPAKVPDYRIDVPDIDDLLMPIPTVVALQLLAYYASVLRGIDPDKPRNLAKSEIGRASCRERV